MSIAMALDTLAAAPPKRALAPPSVPRRPVEACGQLRDLLLAGLKGDAQAHRHFLTKAAPLLRGFFRNRLRGAAEDVEDLVQDTLIALHTRRASYDPSYPLTAWMFAIARYRLIDFTRRRRFRMHEELNEGMTGENDGAFDASDARRDLSDLLSRLPAKQQQAIRLVKLEERPIKEAAALSGFSESDIKISVHRGIKALTRLVADKAA